MTVLSSSYGIILDHTINATGHGNNVVVGLNATYKRYLRGGVELISKLASNYTTNIGMIHSASKDISIKSVYQYLYILNNKERLNGTKGNTKMQKIKSQFKYQSLI